MGARTRSSAKAEASRRLRQKEASGTCLRCDGRGWVGQATGSQFALIGRLAMAGKLPTAECSACNGTGKRPSAS